jgi:hypothetical protein
MQMILRAALGGFANLFRWRAKDSRRHPFVQRI